MTYILSNIENYLTSLKSVIKFVLIIGISHDASEFRLLAYGMDLDDFRVVQPKIRTEIEPDLILNRSFFVINIDSFKT